VNPVNLLPAKHRPRTPTGGQQGSAYVVVGVLGALLVLVVFYVLTINGVNSRKDQVARAKAETAELQAQAGELSAYGNFAAVKEERVQSVKQLADGRIDWERLTRGLARLLPNKVWLISAGASATGNPTVGGGGGAPAGAPAGAPPAGGPPPGAGSGGGQGGGMGAGRGGMGAGPRTYNLDGSETTGDMGRAKFARKATMSADGKTLDLVQKTTFQGPDGEITSTSTDKLTLSADGKMLTVVRHSESPRGTQDSTLVFNK